MDFDGSIAIDAKKCPITNLAEEKGIVFKGVAGFGAGGKRPPRYALPMRVITSHGSSHTAPESSLQPREFLKSLHDKTEVSEKRFKRVSILFAQSLIQNSI